MRSTSKTLPDSIAARSDRADRVFEHSYRSTPARQSNSRRIAAAARSGRAGDRDALQCAADVTTEQGGSQRCHACCSPPPARWCCRPASPGPNAARQLAGLRRQALGRRRQDGDADRQPMVAEPALGRGRRGRLDQLVHQARGGAARARRGRQGQGLQARPRVQLEDAAVRRAPVRDAHPGHADRRAVRRQQDRLARRVRGDRDRPGRAPSSTASATSACRSAPTASATRCASTTATSSRTSRPPPA